MARRTNRAVLLLQLRLWRCSAGGTGSCSAWSARCPSLRATTPRSCQRGHVPHGCSVAMALDLCDCRRGHDARLLLAALWTRGGCLLIGTDRAGERFSASCLGPPVIGRQRRHRRASAPRRVRPAIQRRARFRRGQPARLRSSRTGSCGWLALRRRSELFARDRPRHSGGDCSWTRPGRRTSPVLAQSLTTTRCGGARARSALSDRVTGRCAGHARRRYS